MTPSYQHGLSPSFRYARPQYPLIFDGAMAADVSGKPMVAEIKEEVSSGIRGAARGGAEACRQKGYLHTTVCSYRRHVLGNAVIIFIYSTYVPGPQNLSGYFQVVLLHTYIDILRLMVQTYSIQELARKTELQFCRMSPNSQDLQISVVQNSLLQDVLQASRTVKLQISF